MLHYYHISWFLNIVSIDYRGSENLPSFILLFYCSEIIWFLNIPLSRDCIILYTALISLFYSSFIILYLNIFYSVEISTPCCGLTPFLLLGFIHFSQGFSPCLLHFLTNIIKQFISKMKQNLKHFFFKCQN